MEKLNKLVKLMEETFGEQYHTKILYVVPYLGRGVIEVKRQDIFEEIASKLGASDNIRNGSFVFDGLTYTLNLVMDEQLI